MSLHQKGELFFKLKYESSWEARIQLRGQILERPNLTDVELTWMTKQVYRIYDATSYEIRHCEQSVLAYRKVHKERLATTPLRGRGPAHPPGLAETELEKNVIRRAALEAAGIKKPKKIIERMTIERAQDLLSKRKRKTKGYTIEEVYAAATSENPEDIEKLPTQAAKYHARRIRFSIRRENILRAKREAKQVRRA